MQTDPDFFGTTTMPARYGVGVCTHAMTLSDSIRLSLSRTFLYNRMGTLCGVNKAFLLEKFSYEEMLELAAHGQAVEWVRKTGVTILTSAAHRKGGLASL